MTCEDVRAKLTAYLDGELEDDRGSALRGHLRGCDHCRDLAADEAALRDGLRALPTVDPPHALWASIQRELAAAEVADSERPAWRRSISRWVARWTPIAPQIALGSAALAIAVVVLVVRVRDHAAPTTPGVAILPPPPPTLVTPVPVPAAPTVIEGDVTADLAAEAARTTATYQATADELVTVALASRAQWPDDRKAVFDTKLAALRQDIAAAHDDRPRNKAYRSLIRYLQGVATRDEVAANERNLAGTRGLP